METKDNFALLASTINDIVLQEDEMIVLCGGQTLEARAAGRDCNCKCSTGPGHGGGGKKCNCGCGPETISQQ